MASSSSSPPWIVLSRIANVGDPVGQASGNVTLTRSPPPQVSLLTVSPRLLPEAIAYRDNNRSILTSNNRSIVAVDSSHGILLLQVILCLATPSEPIVVNFRNQRRINSTGLVASYIVVDTTTNTAYALPEPGMLTESARVGIFYSSSGAGAYVVAELQLIKDSGDVGLLYFDSHLGQWFWDCIRFPSPLPPSRFYPDSVLSHDGKLWWVDLSCGLVAWDAFTKLPSLSFFDLPPHKRFDCNRAEAPDLGRHRSVAISAGKIRFIDMDDNNRDDNDRRKVSVWTLQADQDATWLLEYQTTFDNNWSHTSYQSSRLHEWMPVLAFIHPRMPWTIYFFVDRHLFGIDLHGNNMVECVDYQPEVPSSDLVSSRFFHMCDLSSSSGSMGGVAGSMGGVPEEFLQGNFLDKVFNALYGHWKKQQGKITEINEFSRQNGQTMACASQALKNWNSTHDTSYEIDLTEPMDSNSFNKSQKCRVQQSYFHANFYGKSSGAENKKELFFAELKGPVGPENTITVMPLGQDEDAVKDSSAEHICYCCSGLMHPYSKQFVGCKATAMHQHQ